MPAPHGKIVPGSLLLTNGKICPQVHVHRVHENEKGISLFLLAILFPPLRTRFKAGVKSPHVHGPSSFQFREPI